MPPRTLGSAMNALPIALKAPFTLTDLMRYAAVWVRLLKGCDNLLTLCPGQRIKVRKIMPKQESLHECRKSLIDNKA